MVKGVKVWTVQARDKLPIIAASVYGNPRLWRDIADANQINNPIRFPVIPDDVGRVLFIPERKK